MCLRMCFLYNRSSTCLDVCVCSQERLWFGPSSLRMHQVSRRRCRYNQTTKFRLSSSTFGTLEPPWLAWCSEGKCLALGGPGRAGFFLMWSDYPRYSKASRTYLNVHSWFRLSDPLFRLVGRASSMRVHASQPPPHFAPSLPLHAHRASTPARLKTHHGLAMLLPTPFRVHGIVHVFASCSDSDEVAPIASRSINRNMHLPESVRSVYAMQMLC